MSNNVTKRRTIFIDKTFQGRTIVSVSLLIVLSTLCSAALVYWLSSGELQAQSQTAHLSVITTLEHLGISILIANVVAMLIAVVLAVFVVLYASHKISGPLYRFEKLCEHVGDGQLDTITSLREHDQLQALGTAFAGMVAKLRTRRDRRTALLAELTTQLEQILKDPAVANQYSSQIEHIRKDLQQLQD